MPKFAANLSWLFTELDFSDRFAAAAGAGFRGVECLFPYEQDAGDVAGFLADNDLQMVLINAPAGDWQMGARGLGSLPGREDDFRASISHAIDYAGRIGCRRLHVMAGIGGRRETFVDNLRLATEVCAGEGIKLLIEPINPVDMPGYFLDSPAQALTVIDEVDSPHLGLQLDIYHTRMMGLDPAEVIVGNLGLVSHMQVAGLPARNEPDDADFDYQGLFKLIDNIGYDGWIGCEYRPRAATLEGLGWLP
ncbi:MAG: hydroxypyruvate isomerase family protein [Alphaproteobacteria bacterium]